MYAVGVKRPLLLLLPPIRALARTWVLRRIRSGVGFVGVIPGSARAGGDAEVWDVEGWEDPPGSPPTPPSLGP